MWQGKQETIGSEHIGKALKSNFIYLFEPFIIVMRKLFIPLILCFLLSFTLAGFTAPSFETTAPTGSYDKRELIRVEFTILDANQSTFLVDINYSDTSNFGTGTILIQDENIATSSVVNCIQLGNNFSCYYDANLLIADDGDYYALVNVQGQGADASPQFNIYLGFDPEPTEKVYSQRYVNPNYEQRDENIYYNPATAYFLTDSEKQNIYLEQNTYLLIGVLIILGIGVFLLWKKRK